ncbi:phytanoyl-CoA dioxygenase family protein [Pyruvatibacter sp.]|uniref:phytanoyl-CoA dioxygenase family protein n=1 Tax=Pyruvatibacter sp. TaxID=1981328 RepID=UPI0032EAD5C5
MSVTALANADRRFTDDDIAAWNRDGAVLIRNFFTADELAPVVKDFETLYADKAPGADTQARNNKKDGAIGQFEIEQFAHFDDMPFKCSPALNLLGMHPALAELARAALQVEDVHLYQSHSWAKYTGGADYDQTFHCDFKNHTLIAPSDDVRERTINIMIYATDVTDAHGAIHYVTQPDGDTVMDGRRPQFPEDTDQAKLKPLEKSGAAPAGSIFAYGIDVFHRGTNLTAPGGRRFTLTASFKRAGNEMIGWSAWPFHFMKPWDTIFDNATPEQLALIGIPKPGDPFWTPRTLERTRERYPGWNADAYAMALKAAE